MFDSRPTGHGWIVVLAVALLGPAFAGCVTPGDGETGTGAFYVKDAPSDDWRHVNVTFTSVRVHQGEDGAGNESGDWITVAENETGREVDLLAFSSADARALLGVAELENGTYNQVLINVSEAYGIDRDSGEREDFTLTRPQLRLTRAWQIGANETTHLVADIDLDRSIVKQGNDQYRFNPVIGQVIVEQNDQEPRSQRGQSDQAQDGSEDPTDTGGEGQSPMTTYVKDAPTDEFDEIWLEFDQIEVHYAGNGSEDGNETNETDGNETDGRWITTVNETRELDLLKFNETGSKAFLGEADVPTGRYTQIRILVTDAWGVDNNGTEVNITMASSTAKVVRSWNVSDNGTTAQVTIDLNLDRSLVKTGGQGGSQAPGGQGGNAPENKTSEWRMTPVIGMVAVDHVVVDPKQDQTDTEDLADDATQAAQDDDGNETDTQETGQGSAYVKDAPAELSEVWIDFTQVHVRIAGNDTGNETGNETNATDDGSWKTIFEGNRSVDLLNYSENDSKAFLGSEELPVGKYTQIRLNLSDAWAVDDNGTRVNVTIANEMAKINRPFTISANNTTQIVIDVNLDKSLHATGGGSGGQDQGQGQGDAPASYRLTPVIGSVQFEQVDEDPQQDVPDEANAS